MQKNTTLLILVLIFSFLFSSCASIGQIYQINEKNIQNAQNVDAPNVCESFETLPEETLAYRTPSHTELIGTNFAISEEALFDGLEEPDQKFIFLRLYDVYYNRSHFYGDILNSMMGIVGKAPNGIAYDHVSISVDLNDNFVGMNPSSGNDAHYEEIAVMGDNKYMNTNNKYKSMCTVLAIPCTQLEYENCKKLLEYSVSPEQNFIFNIFEIAAMPVIHTANMEKLKKHDLGKIDEFAVNTYDGVEKITPIEDPAAIFTSKSYVCSTFVCFVLYHSLQSVRNFCQVTGVGPRGITPSDLYSLPGSKLLFNCTYSDYNLALFQFVSSHPEFDRYVVFHK